MKTPFTFELKPAAAIAAAGGTANAVPFTLQGDHMVVEEIYAIAEAATGYGIANAALPLLGGTKSADATSPTMNQVVGRVTVGNANWSDDFLPLWAIGLPPSENGVLRTPIVVPAGTQFRAAFRNDIAGYTVTPRIIFKGYKTDQLPQIP
jgi:hypothetical protein